MSTMPKHRRRLALCWLLVTLAVSACGGSSAGTAAPSASPSPAPTTPSPTAVPSAIAGGLSISSILGSTPAVPAGTTWMRVSDPSAAFTYEVPSTWMGHAAYPWLDGDAAVGTVLAAGPDPARLATDFSVPGIAIGISANPRGVTPREAVEEDASYAGVCTPGEINDGSDPTISAAFQVWESCGGGSGLLLVMAIVPVDGEGMIAIVFQGTGEADLAYLEHIVGSLAEAGGTATPTPGPTTGGGPGGPYTISLDICRNQHGQGVSEGLIRNDDSVTHVFRIEVWFYDLNGVLLNTTDWTTTEIPPGVTARWQADVPSGLPSVDVQCQLREVEIVH
jgi:hypothetical protein